MDNKKVLLTILLAAILALILVLIFFIPSKKTPVPEQQKKEVVETQTTQQPAVVEEEETKEEQPEVKQIKELPSVKKVTHKKVQPQKPKQNVSTVKPAVTINKAEEAETKIEPAILTEEEKQIVIPIEYKSQNSYKYTYTPVRYKSK